MTLPCMMVPPVGDVKRTEEGWKMIFFSIQCLVLGLESYEEIVVNVHGFSGRATLACGQEEAKSTEVTGVAVEEVLKGSIAEALARLCFLTSGRSM
ncbi:MAG: hypothetical protein QNL68_07385 [Akkermansiaceae bacterium]